MNRQYLSARIVNFINRVISLNHWVKIYPTNYKYSEWLERQIDDETIPKIITRYTIHLGKNEIWAENWPYSYGGLWYGPDAGKYGGRKSCVPTVRVQRKLKRLEKRLSKEGK